MGSYLKIKKRKIALVFLLIFNQLILSSYAFNDRKIDLIETEEDNSLEIHGKELMRFASNKSTNDENYITQESEDIEKFIEETFDPNNIDNLKNKLQHNSITDKKSNAIDEDFIKTDIKNKKLNNEIKNLTDQPPNTKIIPNKKKSNQRKKDKFILPSRSIISSSEFKVKPRGYVKLSGPEISLNLEETDSLETLKLIASLGGYGIVVINEENSGGEISENPKITAKFENIGISDVFNSILLSANLQAVVENKIIFVGKNVLNKSLKPKVSKTYRLNQVNAASVADYLSTLGANISKVMLISGSMDGSELGENFMNKREFEDEVINSYGIKKGPLYGLVGTADLRLQTITLIGSNDQIKTAETYIKSLDVRHKQVALTVKIIDVSLTKSDIKENVFELVTGDTRIISNGGLGFITGNREVENPGTSARVPNALTGGTAKGQFFNWLEAKIDNNNAKILASPTLILGENENMLNSGAASGDASLDQGTIGRPYKNEGFIKVGETVVTGFEQSSNEGGVTTCTALNGTAGITFGAKLEKVDDNGFVTFALSPAISSVTSTVEIAGCGYKTYHIRKLDTGSIDVQMEKLNFWCSSRFRYSYHI